MRIWTVGHSSRSIEELIALLDRIEMLVDIRTYPSSRHCPHFGGDALAASLQVAGIAYRHLPLLGGRRNKQPGADPWANAGWANGSFRNYADYTLTPGYAEGIAQLEHLAPRWRVAYMCSEAVPWRCHRLLVSNTLVARGHRVTHILNADETTDRELGRWGAVPCVEHGVVTYPSDEPRQLSLAL